MTSLLCMYWYLLPFSCYRTSSTVFSLCWHMKSLTWPQILRERQREREGLLLTPPRKIYKQGKALRIDDQCSGFYQFYEINKSPSVSVTHRLTQPLHTNDITSKFRYGKSCERGNVSVGSNITAASKYLDILMCW